MPRKKVPVSKEAIYHLNARCINKEWFEIPLFEVWEIMEDYLYFISHAFNAEIFSFVLMSNHFHLLMRSPQGNLGETMNYFMRETSKAIGRRSGRINQTYGSRFYRTRIENEIQLHYAYKYIYRNPLRANLCKTVEDYRYSTLSGLLGQHKLIVPVVADHIFGNKKDVETLLTWLNWDAGSEIEEQVRTALHHSLFKFSSKRSGKKSSLEDQLLY